MTVDILPQVIFEFCLIFFIFWQGNKAREPFLYIIGGPICFAIGWAWVEYSLIVGMGVSCIGGYCWYLAIRKMMGR